ncbi:MAG: hypothetical protein K8R16_09470 [Anaerolineales bacterium]|nr:hypothetical protein [Anaerolineales bacterium]
MITKRFSFIGIILLIFSISAACEREKSLLDIPDASSSSIEQSSKDTQKSNTVLPQTTPTIENTKTVEPIQIVIVPKSQMIFEINNNIAVIDPYSPNEINYLYFPNLNDLPNPEPRAVSPDGTKLIVRSVDARVGKFRLFVLDLTSGETHKLIYENASQGIARWGPDSENIAFVLTYENESRIVIVNYLNGSIIEIHGAHRWDSIPCWSPDGERIYFLSYEGQSDDLLGPSPQNDIFEFDIESNELRKLTDEPMLITDFSLSPDGSKFIYTSVDQFGEIFTFDFENGDMTNLTNSISSERNPVWSPNGEKIAFSSERDGNWEIYTMNSNGSSVERITFDNEVDTPIMWSPFSDYLAFISRRSGAWQVYIYVISSGEIKQITDEDDYPYLADITTTLAP